MRIIDLIKTWLDRIFTRDPAVIQKRAELRKLHALLADQHPPIYRPKQNLVLPGLADSLLAFARLLRPLAELVKATVANGDARVAQRHHDWLIECRLTPLARERHAFFSYDGMEDRIRNSLEPEQELERLDSEFQGFLRELEDLGSARVNAELDLMERFSDIARYDYERLLSSFDPGVAIENPGRKADFSPIDGDQALPELLDLLYVLDGFSFEAHLRENLLRLMERRSTGEVGEAARKKIEKVISQLDSWLAGPLAPWVLLALIRAIKSDPAYTPAAPRERQDWHAAFRLRLVQRFHKDRERVERERHEVAVVSDITALFGHTEIAGIEGYDDETDSYLRRESPNGFLWIKPLRVLRTFIASIFEPIIKEPLKRLLVEGYFDNKVFQNNMANVLYQCERSEARIAEFEVQLNGSGRVSVSAVRRYVEELRRGKDIGAFLQRLVDSINGRAREIVEDEAGLFSMLGDSLSEIVADSRKPNPELVTNVRTFGGGRNKEILAQLALAKDRLATLAKIMRNFSVLKAPVAPAAQAEAAAPEGPGPEAL